ncbi:MAG: hypothetical protein ABIC95_03925 [archaeon]
MDWWSVVGAGVIGYLGLGVGVLLAFLSPEEMVSGRKHFLLVSWALPLAVALALLLLGNLVASLLLAIFAFLAIANGVQNKDRLLAPPPRPAKGLVTPGFLQRHLVMVGLSGTMLIAPSVEPLLLILCAIFCQGLVLGSLEAGRHVKGERMRKSVRFWPVCGRALRIRWYVLVAVVIRCCF